MSYEKLAIGEEINGFIYLGLDKERNQKEKERFENGERKKRPVFHLWKCKCGNITSQTRYNILHGVVKSCGCERYKTGKNTYEFYEDYVIGHFTTRDEIFYIDLDDYEKVSKYTWFLNKNGYAYTDIINNNGEKERILLHRYVTNFQYKLCDHKDRNRLNNRKENLRPATHSQNVWNRNSNRDKVIGVIKPKKDNWKWGAYIIINKKRIWLGSFPTEREAIIARLTAEKQYYGEFATQHDLFEKYLGKE